MSEISKDQILASSRGWVASLLNFLPGLGSGYIYQRRWLPYFVTLASVILWVGLGIFLGGDGEPSKVEKTIGFGGLFIISLITVIESNISFIKATKAIKDLKLKNENIKKRKWFN